MTLAEATAKEAKRAITVQGFAGKESGLFAGDGLWLRTLETTSPPPFVSGSTQ
jgi:hypothetical protein